MRSLIYRLFDPTNSRQYLMTGGIVIGAGLVFVSAIILPVFLPITSEEVLSVWGIATALIATVYGVLCALARLRFWMKVRSEEKET